MLPPIKAGLPFSRQPPKRSIRFENNICIAIGYDEVYTHADSPLSSLFFGQFARKLRPFPLNMPGRRGAGNAEDWKSFHLQVLIPIYRFEFLSGVPQPQLPGHARDYADHSGGDSNARRIYLALLIFCMI